MNSNVNHCIFIYIILIYVLLSLKIDTQYFQIRKQKPNWNFCIILQSPPPPPAKRAGNDIRNGNYDIRNYVLPNKQVTNFVTQKTRFVTNSQIKEILYEIRNSLFEIRNCHLQGNAVTIFVTFVSKFVIR